jgi:hypothetical protein
MKPSTQWNRSCTRRTQNRLGSYMSDLAAWGPPQACSPHAFWGVAYPGPLCFVHPGVKQTCQYGCESVGVKFDEVPFLGAEPDRVCMAVSRFFENPIQNNFSEIQKWAQNPLSRGPDPTRVVGYMRKQEFERTNAASPLKGSLRTNIKWVPAMKPTPRGQELVV